MTLLVNEQKKKMCLSSYIDIDAITLCLDFNIFQQDECFCSKLGMAVYAKSNLETSLSKDLGDVSLASFCKSKTEIGAYGKQTPEISFSL